MIVGRVEELREVGALLGAPDREPRALVLRGAPGIGKTTLWREALRLAREGGLTTLAAQPAESEAGLAFGVLRDLVDAIAPDAALTAALEGQASPLAVGRSVLSGLTSLGDAVLLAIDDVQWIDPPSEAALTYALRRLDTSVRVLVATRASHQIPLGLDRAFGHGVITMSIGPMTLGELDLLLREHLGIDASRPQLTRLHAASGGNPFYALEIARSRDVATAEPIALPAHLESLPAARLGSLSPPAKHAVLLVAASSHPAADVIERAASGHDGLDEALAAGVLELSGDRLRVSHPLLATASYANATPWERRAAHARLATVAVTPVERALHLGRATSDPDEQVAATLQAAANEASNDGLPDLAAELADRAAALTPDGSPVRPERDFLAAVNWMTAGDAEGAESRMRRLIDELDAGPLRADVRVRLADLVSNKRPQEAIHLCKEALRDAVDDPGLSATIHMALGGAYWNASQVMESVEEIRESIAAAEVAGDEAALAMSIGELLDCETMLGLPLNDALANRALAIEQTLGTMSPSFALPSYKMAALYTRVDRTDEARPLLDVAMRCVEGAADEMTKWGIHVVHSDLELRAGNLGAALRHATVALESVRMLDYPELEPFALRPLSMALTVTGDLDQARMLTADGLSVVEQTGNDWLRTSLLGVKGTVELLDGSPEHAWSSLSEAVELLRRMQVRELSNSFVAASAIESAVATGRLEDAKALCDWVANGAARPWHAVIAARGRAVIAAETGDLEAARGLIAETLRAQEDLPQPVERARTLLAQGRIERRARNRRIARDALTEALEMFDAMGAARLAEITAAELARISGRAPADRTLSETERRVAELVAAGLSNKEIAAQLFVAVRTVEANLTRVYAKLGIRSRTELAARTLLF